MKISPKWIRDFVSPTATDREVAEALTVSGISIEGYFGEGDDQTWDAEITTNRVDAMNHYGVAREVSAIYDLDIKPIAPKVTVSGAPNFLIEIDDADSCARYTARVVRGVKIAPGPFEQRLRAIDGGRDALNRTVPNVTGREDAGHTGLEPQRHGSLDRAVGCRRDQIVPRENESVLVERDRTLQP